MKIVKHRLTILILILVSMSVMVIGLGGCGGGNDSAGNGDGDKEEVVTWDLAATIPDTHSRSVNVIRPWMNVVHHESGGKIKFRPHWAASLVGPDEQPEALLHGQIDAASTMPGVVADKWPASQVTYAAPLNPDFGAPNLTSLRTYEAIPAFQDQYEGYHVIWEGSGSKMHLYTDKEVKTIDDARGMVIGCSSKWLAKILEKLGMTPLVQPFGEMYTSLERGAIDGVMSSHDPIRSWGMSKLVPYCVELGITTWPNGILVSQKSYDSLPQDLKDAVDSVPQEQLSYWNDSTLKEDEVTAKEEYIEEFGGTVSQFSEEELAKARELIEPVYEEMIEWYDERGLPGKELVETYQDYSDSLTLDDYDEKYCVPFEDMDIPAKY